jgi:hypothetical protein
VGGHECVELAPVDLRRATVSPARGTRERQRLPPRERTYQSRPAPASRAR